MAYASGSRNSLWRYRREVTPQMYIRNLPATILRDIAVELDYEGAGTSWKDLAANIPQSRNNPTPRYNATNIRSFEMATKQGKSPTESVIAAWSTSNSTAQDLVDVLHKLNLPRLADIILPSAPPSYSEIESNYSPSDKPPPFLMPDIRKPHESADTFDSKSNDFAIRQRPVPQESIDYDSSVKPTSTPSSSVASSLKDLNIDESLRLPSFFYETLLELTLNFNESCKLGEGAFGSVYQGEVSDAISKRIKRNSSSPGDTHRIAIKRLKLEAPDLVIAVKEQFKKELEIISELSHENILPLIGYSCDGPELCLVYHYMYNGSLSSNLQACREKRGVLNIKERLDIAQGSSDGIEYLHSKNIIHRDIKSSNILLDLGKRARISDFGLIRSLDTNYDKTSTQTQRSIGTPVYMAPEAYTFVLSPAMDVYGFGVVLLELLTSLSAFDLDRDPPSLTLYIEENYDEDKDSDLISLADSTAGAWKIETLRDFYKIAFKCLEDRRKKRAKITDVSEKLKKISAEL